jgi:hypothetical protein
MTVSFLRRTVIAFGLTVVTLSAQDAWQTTFDLDRADLPPTGFSLAAMRQPGPGRWFVQRTGTTGHLVHAADPAAMGLSLAVADVPSTNDVGVSARVRLPGGGRKGGLVWRYQNDQNFYALLLDLTRQEVALYRMTDGNRVRLDFEDGLELDPNGWHALKVVHVDEEVRVSLGGIRVFDERDRRDPTRPAVGGRAGLVASGHSDVWFDDVHVEVRRGQRERR